MARVENTVRGGRDLNALTATGKDGRKHFPIPGMTVFEGVKTNGSAEVPDEVLDELLAKDAWTKGVFKSGELVDCRKADAEAKAQAQADAKAAKAAAEAEAKAQAEAEKAAKQGK